jgi:hypothetical protein
MTTQCTNDTVDERAVVGTWVLDEVRLAAQKGYQITKAHEVYGYNVTQYDPQTGEGGRFAQSIDTFLKLKTEAGGHPD